MTSPKDLEAWLFAGDYERVVAATAKAADPLVLPTLVGALALSGRLDEAHSAYRLLASGDAARSALVQARFFLIAGFCHAGQVASALRRARESLADRAAGDATSRFWIWQGLALVRFFEGRFWRSRRFARRALAAAVEAAFPYARLLALDLLAHVLVETGEIHAGMRVFSQAESLAEALGYESNRRTLHTASAVFELRFLLLPIEAAVARARAALSDREVSYFTRRNGLLELATAFALSGQGARAREVLDEARQIALPGSDRRGKTRFLIAHALVWALSEGPLAARASLDDAWSSAGHQLTLLAEVGFADVFFVGPHERTLRELPAVARASGIARATLAVEILQREPLKAASRLEDRLCRVLIACQGGTPEARLARVLEEELWGLIPWALGLVPGRRVIVAEDRIITENRGDVAVKPSPGAPSLRLLSALREGYQSRETLVSSVWGLGRYDPIRHSAVINTAVSRLRLALAEPTWIVTHEGGYALHPGVQIVETAAPAVAEPLAPAARPASDAEKLLSWLARNGPATAAEIARALGVSASSALRILRRLESEGGVQRSGRGRATRYHLATEGGP